MSSKTEKSQELKPVYLIAGSDETKVEKAARRLRRRVIADSGSDLNVDILDAGDHPAAEVIQAASTLPFGDGVRLVMVTGLAAWGKADKDAIVNWLADPPAQSVLALVGSGIRRNEAIVKAIESAGQVLLYDAPRPANLPEWAQQQAAERGLKMGRGEARRLVALAGSDQRALMGELDKLSSYLGRNTVTMEDIDELCWVSPEVRIWDLTDALGARDRTAVFRHLEALLADRTAPAAVFFSLARHLRLLAEVAAASERGEEPARAAAALGLKPYPARKLAEQRRNFSAAGLRRALAIFSELDADIKGRSDLRPDLQLEKAVAAVLDAVGGD